MKEPSLTINAHLHQANIGLQKLDGFDCRVLNIGSQISIFIERDEAANIIHLLGEAWPVPDQTEAYRAWRRNPPEPAMEPWNGGPPPKGWFDDVTKEEEMPF